MSFLPNRSCLVALADISMSQSEKNLPLGVINEDARLKGAKHHRRMQTTITDYHPKPPLTFIPEPSSWVPYQDEKFLFCVDPVICSPTQETP